MNNSIIQIQDLQFNWDKSKVLFIIIPELEVFKSEHLLIKADSSLFAPVWIEGVLRTESLTKELFLVDGKSDINLGYAMSPKKIWGYEAK